MWRCGRGNREFISRVNNDVVETVVEIPFLINMGWSFFITSAVMIGISLFGPKVSKKAFIHDPALRKLKPTTVVMIVATIMILAALYVKFW